VRAVTEGAGVGGRRLRRRPAPVDSREGVQSLRPDVFAHLMPQIGRVAAAAGRTLEGAPTRRGGVPLISTEGRNS